MASRNTTETVVFDAQHVQINFSVNSSGVLISQTNLTIQNQSGNQYGLATPAVPVSSTLNAAQITDIMNLFTLIAQAAYTAAGFA
jgi:hypothetical protein